MVQKSKLKTAVKAKKASTGNKQVNIEFKEVKQVYRAFKKIDLSAYQLQGEFTLCNLRTGKVGSCDKEVKGIDIVLIEGSLGIGAIIGKLAKDKKSIQAGKFILSLEGQKVLHTGSMTSARKFVMSNGETLKNGSALGLGAKYGLFARKGGKNIERLESGTCQRGMSWFHSVSDKGLDYTKR